MLHLILFSALFFTQQVYCKYEIKFREVTYEDGTVSAEKYWNGDFYEFFGIPYATVPKGRDRFKGPLPVEPWEGVYKAQESRIYCQQTLYTGEDDSDEIYLHGEEDCLVLNLFVPEVATEDNLVPVMVYIHSGAFAAGNGNMARYHYLVRNDILVISLNYRLGALGFACLGTEDIPGNAGMKDQVAALRWINRNIRKFGGDPTKVTVAGFSVGAAMAELLVLSKNTEGLIDKLVLESGSALSPFAVNRDPINTAKNIAVSMGYNGTTLEELNEFYLSAPAKLLASKSIHFFLTNSTFGFSPCIENVQENVEPFLTESPLNILNKGNYHRVSVLTGFANMEGLSRAIKFDTWSDMMNEDFSPFLPADLKFDSDSSREKVVNTVKEYYFKGKEVNYDTLIGYIDFFSDSMIKYSVLKSANLHSSKSDRPLYFYEFAYVGQLSMRHQFMDEYQGASHRDQSAYILDFFGFTMDYNDFDTRDRMTEMWSDFVKYEDPTAYESPLVKYKWKRYSAKEPHYLYINTVPEMRRDLLIESYQFWIKIYQKYYWDPTRPDETLL